MPQAQSQGTRRQPTAATTTQGRNQPTAAGSVAPNRAALPIPQRAPAEWARRTSSHQSCQAQSQPACCRPGNQQRRRRACRQSPPIGPGDPLPPQAPQHRFRAGATTDATTHCRGGRNLSPARTTGESHHSCPGSAPTQGGTDQAGPQVHPTSALLGPNQTGQQRYA